MQRKRGSMPETNYDPDNLAMSPMKKNNNMGMIPMTSVKKPKILPPSYYQVEQDH
jgi:hypothetical protein